LTLDQDLVSNFGSKRSSQDDFTETSDVKVRREEAESAMHSVILSLNLDLCFVIRRQVTWLRRLVKIGKLER